MSLRKLRAAPFFAIAVIACTRAPHPPRAAPPPPAVDSAVLRFSVTAVDPHVDPCTDFYGFACDGWRKTHPIPPDRTRWSRYAELAQQNLERERAIVEEAAQRGASGSAVERRIGGYYAACMDTKAIDARGLAPLRPILDRIEAAQDTASLAKVVTELHAHGSSVLFEPQAVPDPHDSRTNALFLDVGELGLPAPIDYTKSDEKAVRLRAQYRDHVVRVLRLGGAPPDAADGDAAAVLKFETALATVALSPVEARQLEAQANAMSFQDVRARFPAIDWSVYLATIGAGAPTRAIVTQPKWMIVATTMATADDRAAIRAYLRLIVLRNFAVVGPSALDAEVADFDQRTVRGARELAPRWRRCLGLVDRDVGDDVGRVFMDRFLPAAARARARATIDRVMDAFRADVRASDWLGPDARAAALGKIDKELIVVGGSNRPRSFDGLDVRPDDAFGNRWRALAEARAAEMKDVDKPHDREKFFDSLPQQFGAFGSDLANATGVTAGFLQPPVFDPTMDDAVNFGGYGAVIGHELSHQLDDEGRKHDADGNLRSWWSPEDVARFEERARCFVEEYGRFHAEEGTPIDGKLTLGENIADNGGIRLAFAACKPSMTGPEIDGFTPAQRFFLAWGQILCENQSPEAARRQALTDVHSPGRWRVNGVVSNMPELALAFGCAAGSPMAPANRCKIW